MVSLEATFSQVNPTAEILPPLRRIKFSTLLKIYMATDALALALGFFCSLHLAGWVSEVVRDRPFSSPFSEYQGMQFWCLAAIAAGVVLWLQHKGHYRVRLNFWMELQHIVCALGFAMMADGFFQFATQNDPSRLWLVVGWMIAGIGILALRRALRAMLRNMGLWRVPVLLVGAGATATDTASVLAEEKVLGFDIVAQVKNLPEAFLHAGRSWERLCAAYGAQYVVIALDGAQLDDAGQPMAQLMRESVPFSVSPPRRSLPVLDMVPQYFFNSDVKLLTHNSGLEQPLPRLIKRIFDIAVSGIALVILSPLMAVFALMVARDGGAVFYRHRRVGKNGKDFHCLKFRTMVCKADRLLDEHLASHQAAKAEWEATHKLKDDPRITKIGAFMRPYSLDELPQLFNVLFGQMSLVGPRPIVTQEIEKYCYDIAHYYRVTPGVTGLWQVSGRNDVTYEQRVQMDSWYVRNWSLWHDIAILCKTVPALLKRSGAY